MKGAGHPFNGAAKFVAIAYGVLAGLGGIRHGIGEIIQGNMRPEGVFFLSWTEGPLATNMGGEPAMTIIPNLLITGILALAVSLAVLVWAVGFVDRKKGGLILIALSIAMLLVGGGIAPPILGVLAGVAGIGIRSPINYWRTLYPVNFQQLLAQVWTWIFGVSVLNGVFLFLGSLILVYIFDVNNQDLFLGSFFLAVFLFLLLVVTGIARDIQNGERLVEV
jgi:hypothetical protein